MATYVIFLPGDENAWAAATPEERKQGYAAHAEFARQLQARGHQIVGGAELTHSREATVVRRSPSGEGTLITDGPFAETAEQITGFYLIESDDRADLLDICADLVMAGETVELRETAETTETTDTTREPAESPS